MKKNNISKSRKRFWKTILQDVLKNGLWALLTLIFKVIWNWYGLTILLILTTSLLFLQNLLNIRIPLYTVAIFLLSIILTLLVSQQTRKALIRKSRLIEYFGLLWRIKKNKIITGPFCPKCKEYINYEYNQYTSATNVIFGKDPEYLFTCICGYQVKLNKSSTAIKLDIQQIYIRQIEDHS